MKVAVVGTGYVGLVAGACFAEYGNQVYCVDIDQAKIEGLKQGVMPIYEPGLEELCVRNFRHRRLIFTTDLAAAVAESEIVFVAVGTPDGGDGRPDLRGVLAVASAVGEAMPGYRVIVNKSTVPVGAADQVRAAIAARTKHEFDVVSNPEFLREGRAVDDFMKPERVVIGADGERARALMRELYTPFVKDTDAPILETSVRSAELSKYACNAFLALKISFANDMANLSDLMSANYEEVRQVMGSDSRIGRQFLYAGIGYGGSCFPKDVRALAQLAADHRYSSPLIEGIEAVNERQKLRMLEQLQAHYGPAGLSGKTFAVWGLAFKPGTDDMRDAPSIPLINALLKGGATVRANDPAAHETARAILGDRIDYMEMYACLDGADALLLLTEWPDYQEPDFERIRKALRAPIIFDGRNIYNPTLLRQRGFVYSGIGVNAARAGKSG